MEDKKTYFAPGTTFEGTVTAPGDVLVDGDVIGEIISDGKVSIHKMGDASISAHDLELLGAAVKGDITVRGEVIVDEESSVTGNIRSSSVICAGSVEGNLTATEYVELKVNSKVLGNISAPSMTVGNGALVCGQMRIGEQAS